MIYLENVCLDFQGFSIDQLTFEVMEGEIFGFLGPSGAGKTTTIKLLTKQLEKKSGKIFILGKEIETVVHNDYDNIGILSDTNGLYERMSIEENLQFFASIRNVSKDRIQELLKKMHLYEQKKTIIKKCSKGMRQRVLLAISILHTPKILFLDEPTSGLDPATIAEVHKILIELNKGRTTIFLTTHNMEEADKLCGRIAILNKGKIVAVGSPQDLKIQYAREEIEVLTKEREIIILPKNVAGIQKLQELMQKETCLTIHSKEPNLEEIFLQLTGREF